MTVALPARLALTLALFAVTSFASAADGHKRPITAQDLWAVKRVGAPALSPDGRRQATNVMRKHRLAERLLLDVLHVDWVDVHDEACRWEHVISDGVEEKIADLLSEDLVDPFGNSIPAAKAEGPGEQAAEPSGLVRVIDYLKEHPEGGPVVLSRIGEVLQTDSSLLAEFQKAEFVSGVQVDLVRCSEDTWCMSFPNGYTITLSPWAQGHLLVEAK